METVSDSAVTGVAGWRPVTGPRPNGFPPRGGRTARWGVSAHCRFQASGRFLLAEFIYTMRKTRKAHGDKVILDDVTLNFLPGAKIGVVGPNGAGKSTVLKIMAGLEQPSNGDAFLSPGLQRRHPHAGAEARRDQDGPGERPGRRRRDHGQAQALQRGRRAHGDRLLGRAAWTRWASSRKTWTTPTPGTSTPSWSRPWTRWAARPATGPSPTSPVARSAASRSASC